MKASPKKPTTRDALTQDYLKELLRYEPETGEFYWLVDRNEQVRRGDRAGHLNPEGYRVIGIHARNYGEHRLAWLYMMSVWPNQEIDHINHVRHDNRWVNLRAADRQINTFNVSPNARPDNICGIKGICKWRGNGKWHARIQHNKVKYHLGYFDTPEEAKAAYVSAATVLGRHIPRGPS